VAKNRFFTIDRYRNTEDIPCRSSIKNQNSKGKIEEVVADQRQLPQF
jgi:hypothetical protein